VTASATNGVRARDCAACARRFQRCVAWLLESLVVEAGSGVDIALARIMKLRLDKKIRPAQSVGCPKI